MAQLEKPATISSALLTSMQGHDADPHLGMSEEDQGHFAAAIGAPGLNEPLNLAAVEPVYSNPAYHIEETRAFMEAAATARVRAASAPSENTPNS